MHEIPSSTEAHDAAIGLTPAQGAAQQQRFEFLRTTIAAGLSIFCNTSANGVERSDVSQVANGLASRIVHEEAKLGAVPSGMTLLDYFAAHAPITLDFLELKPVRLADQLDKLASARLLYAEAMLHRRINGTAFSRPDELDLSRIKEVLVRLRCLLQAAESQISKDQPLSPIQIIRLWRALQTAVDELEC